MSNKSRYIRSGRNPLPKKPRSKDVPGSFEDDGKYIRCWNCNSIINTERLSTRGSGNGNIFTDFTIPVYNYESNESSTGVAHLTIETVEEEGAIIALGPDGEPLPTYTPRKSVAYRGCWLCGTLNLP